MSARVGGTLGAKYRLVREVGAGAMGIVFEATNQNTGRRVAIKMLQPDSAGCAEVVERFLLEARAATRIRHPNVVDILDMDVTPDGAPYIVQDFLEGVTLEDYLEAKPSRTLPAAEALALLAPVMRALEHAHELGIVHRDLKPSNIFLCASPDGTFVPKVIDFGVAKVSPDAALALHRTRTGAILGTPGYMSPEQVNGDPVDRRSDVWSMGVVLYQALSGRLPFDALTIAAMLGAILRDRPTPLWEATPTLEPALCAVVDRALARDLSVRHPTMRAFLAALEAPEVEAPAPPSVEVLASQPTIPAEAPKAPRPASAPPKRRAALPPRAQLLVVGAGVASFAALAWHLLPPRHRAPEAEARVPRASAPRRDAAAPPTSRSPDAAPTLAATVDAALVDAPPPSPRRSPSPRGHGARDPLAPARADEYERGR